MSNSTTETYQAKREILTYAKKLSEGANLTQQKFISDMIYGMIASESVLLSDISDSLKEPIKKKNVIERLSNNLQKPLSVTIHENYIKNVTSEIPTDPVILLDDSDIIKPKGKKFESLGYVRDGSSSEGKRDKGYWVAEAVALSKDKQPISLYSQIYSQNEKNFSSSNTYTFQAIDAAISSIDGTGTFVCDRGYDANKMFKYFYEKEQNYIIRLNDNRKLFFKGKWYKATTLCKSRKGKFKTILNFKGSKVECYISVMNVQITYSKKPLRLVLVYGLGDMPMMLATNRKIKGKEDAIKICRTYLSRWRIEEYFRFKKQHFGFEGFRVRSLQAINNLNTLLSYAISFMNRIMRKPPSSVLKKSIYEKARPLKERVLFHYYRIAKGLSRILAYAKTGIKGWFKSPSHKNRQVQLKLIC